MDKLEKHVIDIAIANLSRLCGYGSTFIGISSDKERAKLGRGVRRRK